MCLHLKKSKLTDGETWSNMSLRGFKMCEESLMWLYIIHWLFNPVGAAAEGRVRIKAVCNLETSGEAAPNSGVKPPTSRTEEARGAVWSSDKLNKHQEPLGQSFVKRWPWDDPPADMKKGGRVEEKLRCFFLTSQGKLAVSYFQPVNLLFLNLEA